MDLFTQHNFSIIRQLENPALTGPYYVQAVIRNAYTDAIIATISLTDKTNQRFKGDWAIPADPSGQGFYVSIVTSVYSDAGYTTKSTDYGDEENTYLVVDNPRLNKTGGGGGISRRDISDIFEAKLGTIATILKAIQEKDIEFPEQIKYDSHFESLSGFLREIKDAMPKFEKTNLDPVQKALSGISKVINEISKRENLDLTPVLNAVKDANENGELSADEMKSLLSDLESKLVEAVDKCVTEAMKNQSFVTSFITHPVRGNDNIAENKKIRLEKPLEDPIDITNLTD